MTLAETLTILALIGGPIAAVQIQKRLDVLREERGRKLWIFKTLMATRAATVSAEHVQALNMIDLEFHGERYRAVTGAWRTYLDHLNSYPKDDEKRQPLWAERNIELLASLLMVMGKTLGYDFDEVHVKKGIYFPQAHGDIDLENRLIRRGLVRLLFGDSALKMNVTGLPVDTDVLREQKELRDFLLQLLDGKREFPVRISRSNNSRATKLSSGSGDSPTNSGSGP